MHWMAKWAGGFPLFVAEGQGAHFTDVDGLRYLDLCLGDTGAMTGHAPKATVEAVKRQAERGFTFMLPSEDHVVVGRGTGAALRAPLLAIRADGDRRQPVRDPPRADAHRPSQDPGLQLVLPRHG